MVESKKALPKEPRYPFYGSNNNGPYGGNNAAYNGYSYAGIGMGVAGRAGGGGSMYGGGTAGGGGGGGPYNNGYGTTNGSTRYSSGGHGQHQSSYYDQHLTAAAAGTNGTSMYERSGQDYSTTGMGTRPATISAGAYDQSFAYADQTSNSRYYGGGAGGMSEGSGTGGGGGSMGKYNNHQHQQQQLYLNDRRNNNPRDFNGGDSNDFSKMNGVGNGEGQQAVMMGHGGPEYLVPNGNNRSGGGGYENMQRASSNDNVAHDFAVSLNILTNGYYSTRDFEPSPNSRNGLDSHHHQQQQQLYQGGGGAVVAAENAAAATGYEDDFPELTAAKFSNLRLDDVGGHNNSAPSNACDVPANSTPQAAASPSQASPGSSGTASGADSVAVAAVSAFAGF